MAEKRYADMTPEERRAYNRAAKQRSRERKTGRPTRPTRGRPPGTPRTPDELRASARQRKAATRAAQTPKQRKQTQKVDRERHARLRASRKAAGLNWQGKPYQTSPPGASPKAPRATPDPATAAARAMLDDALEAYRALLANLRHWQNQPNVPAARIEGLQRSVAAAKRGVLEAQAYLLRVRSPGSK